ncbi:MAG: hypothetical protein NTZ16_12070 [Verrucomicrobia bacterium]|nr:hypothetical protein [Verrucomicrobiota bacterium]
MKFHGVGFLLLAAIGLTGCRTAPTARDFFPIGLYAVGDTKAAT